jgi:hypothetical protein
MGTFQIQNVMSKPMPMKINPIGLPWLQIATPVKKKVAA